MAITAKQITARLRNEGIPVTCHKGHGYIYFMAADDAPFDSGYDSVDSIYVNSMNDVTADEVIQHVKDEIAK